MDETLVSEICGLYGLGEPTSKVRAVQGGLIHKMWHLKTTHGEYAIKELNLRIQDLDSDISSENSIQKAYELTESIARTFLENGIPAVTALKTENEYVSKIADKFVLVFEWREGTTLPITAASKDQAFLIGKTIAQIHKTNLTIPGLNANTLTTFSNAHWKSLFEKFSNKFPDSMEWTSKELVLDWNTDANEIRKELSQHLVITHGDIDQKNVIWDHSGHPHLIDWESAGQMNLGLELMDAALNWSGLVSGEVDEDSMKALIDGYKEEGLPVLEQGPVVLAGCVIKWLPWLEFNMQRAINSEDGSEEQKLGFSQTQNTLRNLDLITKNYNTWANFLA